MRTDVVNRDVVGVLSDLAVDEGEVVAAGQLICLLESMKVMYQVHAPVTGTVRFAYELGDVIGEGDVVAYIDA